MEGMTAAYKILRFQFILHKFKKFMAYNFLYWEDNEPISMSSSLVPIQSSNLLPEVWLQGLQKVILNRLAYSVGYV